MNEVGAKNVVHMTNNESNYKNACQKLEQAFSHIKSSGCAAYEIHLVLEYKEKLDWMSHNIA